MKGRPAVNSSPPLVMTAAARRLQDFVPDLNGVLTLAEATGLTGRCPHVPGRGLPGMLASSAAAGARTDGRRLAGLGQVAAGARGPCRALTAVVTHSFAAPFIRTYAGG